MRPAKSANAPSRTITRDTDIESSSTALWPDDSTGDAAAIHFDPRHVHEPAPTVPASREQISESDFVYFRQIRLLHPALTTGDDTRDVKRQPTHVRDRDFRFEEERRVGGVRAFSVVADEPCAVRQLHQ